MKLLKMMIVTKKLQLYYYIKIFCITAENHVKYIILLIVQFDSVLSAQ